METKDVKKPEAGQWWFPNNVKPGMSASQRGMCIVGYITNGDVIGQTSRDGAVTSWSDVSGYHHEPRCTGWDWVVPQPEPATHCRIACQASKVDGVICPDDSCDIEDGLREALSSTKDQPAEDPGEWVVLDSVRYADHVPRVGIDEWSNPGTGWYLQKPSHHSHTVGICHQAYGTIHRCRRRDLPKVEPSTDKSSAVQATSGGYKKALEIVAALPPEERNALLLSGMSHNPTPRKPVADNRVLGSTEPQPQKTRVRLWATQDGIVWMDNDALIPECWQEIHHDSEGFYVEDQQ